jgi:hypothetical protein
MNAHVLYAQPVFVYQWSKTELEGTALGTRITSRYRVTLAEYLAPEYEH